MFFSSSSLIDLKNKNISQINFKSPLFFIGNKVYTDNSKKLENENENENLKKFESIEKLFENISFSFLWFTYRKNFPDFLGHTSDSGWGCTYRTGQMMLAKTFMNIFLGKDWEFHEKISKKEKETYHSIIKFFLDNEKSPYSIHNISKMGKEIDKKDGEWFGPNTIAQTLKKLVQINHQNILQIYVGTDTIIYKDELKSLQESTTQNENNQIPKISKQNKWKPLLVILPVYLGVQGFNPIYYPLIKEFFHFPQFIGIIGGKPSSSHYFIGYQDEMLLYLDPHTVQPYIDLEQPQQFELHSTYQPAFIYQTNFKNLDPSMALCFLCLSQKEFDNFENLSKIIFKKNSLSCFSFAEKVPDFDLEDEIFNF